MSYPSSLLILELCSVMWVWSSFAAVSVPNVESSEIQEPLAALKNNSTDIAIASTEDSTITPTTLTKPRGIKVGSSTVDDSGKATAESPESIPSLSDTDGEVKSNGAVPGGIPGGVPGPGAGPVSGSGLQGSSNVKQPLKEKAAEEGSEGNTSPPGADRLTTGQSGLHKVKDNFVAGAASQSQPNQSQSQQRMSSEEHSIRKSKAGGSTDSRETTGREVGPMSLGEVLENNGEIEPGKSTPTKTTFMPQRSLPFSEAHPTRLQEGSASTDITIPSTLSTHISPIKTTKDDAYNVLDKLQSTSNRPHAQIVTDVSDPTTTEAQVPISQMVLATTVTTGDNTTTTTIMKSTEPTRKVDMLPPLPTVHKSVPLLKSVATTDGILCSSSLFALAALATLAVAAAAPAH